MNIIDKDKHITTIDEVLMNELRTTIVTLEEGGHPVNCLKFRDRKGKYYEYKRVQSGRWKYIFGSKWYLECSECGEAWHRRYIDRFKFCPNCGARMGDEEDGGRET